MECAHLHSQYNASERELTMLVFGGYFMPYDQFTELGRALGLDIPTGAAGVFNKHLETRGVKSIYAWPVYHPRPTKTTPGVGGILIACRKRIDDIERFADCKPFEPNAFDLKVKKWLEGEGFPDVPFVAVPDPYFKINEDGTDYE